jgi:hypothetical protein
LPLRRNSGCCEAEPAFECVLNVLLRALNVLGSDKIKSSVIINPLLKLLLTTRLEELLVKLLVVVCLLHAVSLRRLLFERDERLCLRGHLLGLGLLG